MIRLLVCACFTVVGCSGDSRPNAADQRVAAEIADGGKDSTDRNIAQEYLLSLKDVVSAEEEKILLSEFGQWLRERDYAIQVVAKDGKHDLSCPYFPPDTPWVSHVFLDIKNLELLPRVKNGSR